MRGCRAAIYVAAYHVGPLADFDGRALRAVHALQTPEVHDRAGSCTEFLNLLPFSIAAGIVLVGALASGGSAPPRQWRRSSSAPT